MIAETIPGENDQADMAGTSMDDLPGIDTEEEGEEAAAKDEDIKDQDK